jgi:integrase
MVVYSLLGKRKRVWRSTLEAARTVAEDACVKITNGEHMALELRNGDRMTYLRAVEASSTVNVTVDTACREYAAALQILAGRSSLAEVCREWISRYAVELPKISVADAVLKLQTKAKADGKSKARLKQLEVLLGRFAESFNCDVHTLTPKLISDYLSAMPLSERSKRNHRDVLGFFFRWLILQGYLVKGTDLLEGVQNYSARKIGAIGIYSPDELKTLLAEADKRLVPFLAIAAFAGLRHSEISRLDWRQVELSAKPGESFIEVLPIENTKSDQRRRLVPVRDNLKAWLRPYLKTSGKVCQFENITNQLLKLAASAGVAWKKNALRHSCISYRVADSGDVPRVSDESGNSVQVIRTNYLRRVKPVAQRPRNTTRERLPQPTPRRRDFVRDRRRERLRLRLGRVQHLRKTSRVPCQVNS